MRDSRIGFMAGVVVGLGLLAGTSSEHPAHAQEMRATEFTNHGVPVEAARSRGTVAAEDGEGRPVILTWLGNSAGASRTSLLVVDVESGESRQHWPGTEGQGNIFSSLLTDTGHYYGYTDDHLMVYDLNTHDWLAVEPGPGRFGLGFAEADDGTVYAGLNPDNHLIEFDPRTREMTVHGPIYESEHTQSPRRLAVDDTGWVYIAVTRNPNNLLGFNPETGEVRHFVDEEDLVENAGTSLYRGEDGAVYGRPNSDTSWQRLYAGEAEPLDQQPDVPEVPAISGTQGLEFRQFPGGEHWLSEIDVVERRAVVESVTDLARTGEARTWEESSRSSNPGRATDGDYESYSAVPTGRDWSHDLPKDLGVAWQIPVTFEQVKVVYHSPGYQPAEDGHELQIWRDGQWQAVDADVTVEDEIVWSYRLSEPVTSSRVRVFVDAFDSNRTAIRMFQVFERYRDDRDPRRQPEAQTLELALDYEAEGALISALASDEQTGRVFGASGRPSHFFVYDPQTDAFETFRTTDGRGYFKVLDAHAGQVFGGTYSAGLFKQYDAEGGWYEGEENPRVVGSGRNDDAMIVRPYAVLVHPDERHALMTGFYDWRGVAGGGMLIHDMDSGENTKRAVDELLVGHSTNRLDALPDGNVIAGTRVDNRGRVEPEADEAKIYVLDMDSKRIVHDTVPIEGATRIDALKTASNGKVIGLARSWEWGGDGEEPYLFVFDPDTREIVHVERFDHYGRIQHNFFTGPDDRMLYGMFENEVVQLDPQTLAHRPIGEHPGDVGWPTVLGGRVFFRNDRVELWSFKLERAR